jgi:alpha-N-acetylglucosamine transferase
MPPLASAATVFWGAALQKLHVFNQTRFRKVLWMDSDTLVLRNVDHLLAEPTFTGACVRVCGLRGDRDRRHLSPFLQLSSAK